MFETLDEAALVARITEQERVKSAAAADQARATAALHARRHTANRTKGLGSEIGLARHDSPKRGREHLGFAITLVNEMPHTLAALEAGVLSEYRATLIVNEAAYLTAEDRAALDAEMCADQKGLAGLGNKRITNRAKSIAYRLDSQAAADRAAQAPERRGVAIRRGADGTGYVTVLLPWPQAQSVYGALGTAADTCVDGRPRGHVMADTVVERITGRSADVPVPVAVSLVITDETLLAGDSTPAQVPGYGPIPATIARRLITTALWDDRSKVTLRRLYKHPSSGALVAMESRARLFPKSLSAFINLRDDTCRTPYCDAPIRHHDHAQPHHRDGPTNATNGLGACEACNYAKEAPGWNVTTAIDEHGTHTAEFTTPTGAVHRSNAA